MNIVELVGLGVQLLALLGILPRANQYFSVGRRSARASLIAQLAQDVLALVTLQKGVSPSVAASLEESIELLRAKLVGAGVDPAKALEIARSSMAGAAVRMQAGDAARVVAKDASRDKLVGGQ